MRKKFEFRSNAKQEKKTEEMTSRINAAVQSTNVSEDDELLVASQVHRVCVRTRANVVVECHD